MSLNVIVSACLQLPDQGESVRGIKRTGLVGGTVGEHPHFPFLLSLFGL